MFKAHIDKFSMLHRNTTKILNKDIMMQINPFEPNEIVKVGVITNLIFNSRKLCSYSLD